MSLLKTQLLAASILVVDDDLNTLRLLQEILIPIGYNVRPIQDSQRVLSLARTQAPDLILLNIMMPIVNGFEICVQLKADEITSHIPVIFLSSSNEAEHKIKAFSLGGVDYITKPFHPQEIIARIENQLQIGRLQKELKDQNKKLQKEIQERQLMEKKALFGSRRNSWFF